MKKVTLSVFALSLVFLATGCGDSPDSVMKDTIKLMNDYADVLEKIKSTEDAKKYKDDLEKIQKRGKEIEERAKKLKLDDLPKEKKEALVKKHEDDLKKAGSRLSGALTKAAPHLGGDLLKQLSIGPQDFSKGR